jgi:hypothetical protein
MVRMTKSNIIGLKSKLVSDKSDVRIPISIIKILPEKVLVLEIGRECPDVRFLKAP